MKSYRILLLIFCISFLPISAMSQKKVKVIQARESSEYLNDYVKFINSKQITSKNFKTLPFVDMKKLVALNFLAKSKNPYELYTKKDQYGKYIYSRSANFFEINNGIEQVAFENKKLLKDLYYAPCVLVGKITKVDTLFSSPESEPFLPPYFIIKYEFEISDNMNNIIDSNLNGNRIDFLFSTGHRMHYPTIENQKFQINMNCLIFLNLGQYDFKEVSLTEDEENLPLLHITSSGNEYFEITDNYVKDERNYFGSGTDVRLDQIKDILKSAIEEFLSWR